MSCAEVAMNKAMVEKYHHALGEYPERGLILCILEDGALGIDFDKTMSEDEKRAMDYKLCVFLGCNSGWDSPCTGNKIGGS